jgi:hypothetical protein
MVVALTSWMHRISRFFQASPSSLSSSLSIFWATGYAIAWTLGVRSEQGNGGGDQVGGD